MNRLASLVILLALLSSGCAVPASQALVESVTIAPATQIVAASATAAPSQTVAPTASATISTPTPQPQEAVQIEEVVNYEMKGSFDFFWEQANTDASSPGYGLIRDRYPGSEGIASIASLGFGLTATLIGIEKGYITHQEGYDRVNRTLDTLLQMERKEGFFYHFVDQKTGQRAWQSEISSIDTTILLMGVLSAGQYFGDEIQTKAQQVYDAVNWPWFIDESRHMFYMAYRPEKGFEGHWDFYAEQLMMYVLAAGSDTHPVDEAPYYSFQRHYASYGKGKPFIHSWFGSIFTYQYSHAWIDFRGYTDREKVNWFDNSVEASLAQVNFAIDKQAEYKTLGPDAWGLSACDGPGGYNGLYGAPPSGFDNRAHQVDDTLPPSGAIGSIIFLPEQTQRAMLHFYSFEKLKGKYGFKDAFNLSKNWYASDVIGIDKGVTLLMLANFQDETVYKIMMENRLILRGLDRLQITKDK